MTWNWEETKTYDPVTPGTYTVTLQEATLDETKTPPRLNVQYKLQNNRRLWQAFSFDEKGNKWVTWQFGVLHLNTKAKSLVTNPETATNLDVAKAYTQVLKELVGTPLVVEVTHQEYQGKTKEKVTLVDASSTSAPTMDLTKALGIQEGESLPF